MGKGKKKKTALGIDIGGTGIKAGIVSLDRGTILSPVTRRPTPRPATPPLIIESILELSTELDWSGAIGCGFPGVVQGGKTITAANLHKEWLDYPLLATLHETFNTSAAVINDADAAGLAEMRFGAGRSFFRRKEGLVLVITLGTGIGSAMFYRGKLIPNLELGHLSMNGQSAEKYAATVVREKENLDWPTWGKRVNDYLLEIEKTIFPDLIIIGGGVSASWDKFAKYLKCRSAIVAAQLRNDAGIIGAALGLSIPEFSIKRREK